jgi:hypothetical protein
MADSPEWLLLVYLLELSLDLHCCPASVLPFVGLRLQYEFARADKHELIEWVYMSSTWETLCLSINMP